MSTPLSHLAAVVLVFPVFLAGCLERDPLTPGEMVLARSLSLASLPSLPDDPSNRFADNPKAAELGRELFFDERLSSTGRTPCASCHRPDLHFQDGLPLAVAKGINVRRTMPLAGAQWGSWFFWDGRKDSQWSQALGPLENPVEQAMARTDVVKSVLANHGEAYQAVFGPPPPAENWLDGASPILPGEPQQRWQAMTRDHMNAVDSAFANIGKAIAAFERTLLPRQNRFDRFVEALEAGLEPEGDAALSEEELKGFRLFIGKGNCNACHSGPRLTDDFFHNTGVPFPETFTLVDYGRAAIVEWVKLDPFSCLGPHSDAEPTECKELRFMATDQLLFEGAFKTPTLRDVADRPPYMHAGQLASLEEVIDHYDAAPDPFSDVPDAATGEILPHGRHSEVQPLNLTDGEKADLVAFLKTL